MVRIAVDVVFSVISYTVCVTLARTSFDFMDRTFRISVEESISLLSQGRASNGSRRRLLSTVESFIFSSISSMASFCFYQQLHFYSIPFLLMPLPPWSSLCLFS